LYANVDGFTFREPSIPVKDRPEIDRWILSSLNSLTAQVRNYLDDYEPTQAARAIEEFVDSHLSNWYVRLSRRRFWKGEYEQDKVAAYQTLYFCLETVARLMAPISPFFTEMLYRNLNEVSGRQKENSVHHVLYPEVTTNLIDRALEERMQMAQDIASLILSLRKKVNIRVRQPLQRVLIPVSDAEMKLQLQLVEDLVKSEVNVKQVEYLEQNNEFIRKKIRPNFVALGKRLGAKMKTVADAFTRFTQNQIATIEKDGSIVLQIDNEPLILQRQEVEITSEDIPGWMVATKDLLTVALDVTVTPELESEGNARELVNRIQKIRKDNGFELTDRIIVQLTGDGPLKKSIAQFNSYICAEILADKLELVPELPEGTEIEVNDIPLKVFVSKKA
jgi:isoleucyl-tRNA synthetase